MDEEVVAQLGLLLTQVRYSRHALEGIEHATTRYAGIALQVSGSGGAGGTPWGAPPMLDGALKVYIVNISDLTEGSSIGDVLSGVIGGIGRFIGAIPGGLIGGTLSGITFPWLFAQVRGIVEALDRILARIGRAGPGGESGAPAGIGIMDQLQSVASLLREVSRLFGAATSAPPASGAGGGGIAESLQPALQVATAATLLVNGLILLLPLVVGALASLIGHLDGVQLAILDMLEFALRSVLLLRAAILGTVLDTLSLVGRLAATTLGLLATAADTVLASMIRVLLAGLDTTLTALQIASSGIKNTIDALMVWLRDGLGPLLAFIGNLRIFRLIVHLAQVLPMVLPAVARIVNRPLSNAETEALGGAARMRPSGSGGASTSVPIAPFPDVATTALPAAARAELRNSIAGLGTTLRGEVRTSLDATRGALAGIGTTMRGAVDGMDRNLGDEIRLRSRIAGADVSSLTDAMREARRVAAERPATGLEAIATAYEGWLQGGGMRTLMEQITEHFRATPANAASAGASIPGRTVTAVLADRSDRRVVVEVDEVVIELGPAPAGTAAATAPTTAAAGFDADGYLDWRRELDDRGALLPA
ncbi:MAG: hypothetical protein ACRD12_02865 [Acidimicrobiales bacterium]